MTIIPLNIQLPPEFILRKRPFVRIKPSAKLRGCGQLYQAGSSGYDIAFDPLCHNYLTQSDFMREFDVNAHAINSIKEYPDQFLSFAGDKAGKGAKSKYIRKVQTRVAMAIQQYILTKRLTTLTGNNIDLSISNSSSGKEAQKLLALFQEGWNIKSMENAIFQALRSDLKVGDTAIVFHKDNGELGWQQYGFDKGDTLYPHYDPKTGKLALFGRRYYNAEMETDGSVTAIEYLDVWDKTMYLRYRRVNNGQWVLDVLPEPHGFPFIPVAYHRYGEPCWANSQPTIEKYELAMSQLAENNAQYALRILTLLGASMELESTVDGTPAVINSPSSDAKVGYLEPADASGSFDVQLKKYEDAILRYSFVVKTPEMKSGADLASSTMRMLFAEAYQKAVEDAQEYQPFLNDIVRIFKEGYGTELGKTSYFEGLHVKAEILPYIFTSETEIVNAVVQLRGAGALSRRSASDVAYKVLGYGTIDEADRVLQEQHDELVGGEEAETKNTIAASREA